VVVEVRQVPLPGQMASNNILDNWEDFNDYDAPTTVKKQNQKQSKTKAVMSKTTDNVIVTEDTHRTQYKPQIRILKREPQDSAHNSRTHPNGVEDKLEAKPKAKTLAQRQAEYDEARRRILGSSYGNPQETSPPQPQIEQPPPPSLVPPFPPPPLMPISALVPPFPPPLSQPGSYPTPPPSSRDCNPVRLVQRMGNLSVNSNIMRQPSGPDGTRGFSGIPPLMPR